jgi:hypothetical protein
MSGWLLLMLGCDDSTRKLVCVQNSGPGVVRMWNNGREFSVYPGNALCVVEGPVQILP